MAIQRILLVEDEPDLRLALLVRLRAAGFQCESANNGKEALEHIAQQRPDLIVTDLLMGVMDGYELVRYLKASRETASIPVVVMTALPEHSRVARADELQGVHLLERPFEARELIVMIRALLALQTEGGPGDARTQDDPRRG